jgi:hypothetical protein
MEIRCESERKETEENLDQSREEMEEQQVTES